MIAVNAFSVLIDDDDDIEETKDNIVSDLGPNDQKVTKSFNKKEENEIKEVLSKKKFNITTNDEWSQVTQKKKFNGFQNTYNNTQKEHNENREYKKKNFYKYDSSAEKRKFDIT